MRVGKQHRALRHHVGVEVARGEGRVADVALDQIGLAGALLELARLRRTVRPQLFGSTGLPPRISPALANNAVLTWNSPPCVSHGSAIVRARLIVTPARAASVKSDGRDPAILQIIVDRLEQAFQRIIADHAFVHRHEIGRIARRHLRRQLRIAGPGDDVDVDVDVRVLGVEAVDQRGDDPALAFGLGDVGAAAIFGAAFAEEALQIEVRPVIGLARSCRARQREQQRGEARFIAPPCPPSRGRSASGRRCRR